MKCQCLTIDLYFLNISWRCILIILMENMLASISRIVKFAKKNMVFSLKYNLDKYLNIYRRNQRNFIYSVSWH